MKRFFFFILLILITPLIVSQAGAESKQKKETEPEKTKDEQLRQIMLEQAKLKMEQAKAEMDKKLADWKDLQKLQEQDVVTAREVSDAKEEYERAKLSYETAKLELQQTELDSLKAAWHITIENAERRETEDGRELLKLKLKNASQPVELEYSSKVLGKDIKVSAEIDDIFVSIKDQSGAIVAQPYEIKIDTLSYNDVVPLEFELIKENIQDVVVELSYLDIIEERNIHLKQEEPYISVISTSRYKAEDGKRHLEIVLKHGAVQETRNTPVLSTSRTIPSVQKNISSSSEAKSAKRSVHATRNTKHATLTTNQQSAIEEDDVLSAGTSTTELNNIYVSIRDDTDAIIGMPYEIKIPTLKYQQETTLDFELRKNIDNVVVFLRYLDSEHKRNIYLEPDTRHISIVSAKKYRSKDRIMAKIVLQNTTKEEISPSATPEEIAAANEIRGIYVSLKSEGTIIAQPYDQKIELLGFNDTAELEFELQKDVDEITVALEYLDVENDERKVYLQKESREDVVNVSSLRFSQEGNLGDSVSYDLVLDRLAETEKTFQLRVINLLDQLSFEFMDPTTRSRMSQVKFTRAKSRRNISLVVHLPEKLSISLLDKEIPFYVAVLDPVEAQQYGSEVLLNLAEKQVRKLKGGFEKLVLTPKGVPEMELTSPNLYHEIKTDERVVMKAILKNTGTRNLSKIDIIAEIPIDWKKQIEPELVESLKREEEREINIVFIPAPDEGVGDREIRLRASCTMDNKKVETREKTVRVHIEAKSSISGSVILVSLLILAIVGIALLTIRLSRR